MRWAIFLSAEKVDKLSLFIPPRRSEILTLRTHHSRLRFGALWNTTDEKLCVLESETAYIRICAYGDKTSFRYN